MFEHQNINVEYVITMSCYFMMTAWFYFCNKQPAMAVIIVVAVWWMMNEGCHQHGNNNNGLAQLSRARQQFLLSGKRLELEFSQILIGALIHNTYGSQFIKCILYFHAFLACIMRKHQCGASNAAASHCYWKHSKLMIWIN